MRKSVFILFISLAWLVVSGCRKTDTNTIPYGASKNYSDVSSVPSNTGSTFSFTKITLNPNPVKIGIASKLMATATSNNLTYTWSTSHGDLFGTGSAIYYSDSC